MKSSKNMTNDETPEDDGRATQVCACVSGDECGSLKFFCLPFFISSREGRFEKNKNAGFCREAFFPSRARNIIKGGTHPCAMRVLLLDECAWNRPKGNEQLRDMEYIYYSTALVELYNNNV